MKSIKTKKHNKKVIIATSSAIVLLVALFCYVFLFHGSLFGWQPSPSVNNNAPTDEQIENGNTIKNSSLDNQQTKPGASGSDQPPSPVEQPDSKSIVELNITAANQTASSLQIRAIISTLDASGTCTLTLQNSKSSTITKTATAQASSNTSTCKGFDVPISELSAGQWQVTINYETPTLTGSAAKTITIE